MPNKLDLAGKRFGNLVVVCEDGRDRHGAVMWSCRCDCGRSVRTRGSRVASGKAKSCGCEAVKAAAIRCETHGMSKTELYARWRSMLSRCVNRRSRHYRNYGGRGIVVCDQWRGDFEQFAKDMGDGFSPDLELERIDTNGPYCPENCKWATRQEQQRNKRNNHRLTVGDLTLTLVEWEERTGLKANTILTRIRRGWSPERSIGRLAREANR